jgi:hypothetical protein
LSKAEVISRQQARTSHCATLSFIVNFHCGVETT